jgi:hypothetical protein
MFILLFICMKQRNKTKERDINVGMNTNLDCPYIIRFVIFEWIYVFFFICRYTKRFEQDGNTFVIMNYMENVFFYYYPLYHNFNCVFYGRLTSRLFRSFKKIQCTNK